MLVVEEVVVLVLELVVEIILKNKVSGGDERGRETRDRIIPAIEAGDWAASALELKPLGNWADWFRLDFLEWNPNEFFHSSG